MKALWNAPETTVEDEVKQRNKKRPGQDGIYNELLKYGGTNLKRELTKLIVKKIILRYVIPINGAYLQQKNCYWKKEIRSYMKITGQLKVQINAIISLEYDQQT